MNAAMLESLKDAMLMMAESSRQQPASRARVKKGATKKLR